MAYLGGGVSFRPAKLEDAGLLYAWRLMDEMAAFYKGATSYDDHLSWLIKRLNTRTVKLLIWEEDRHACGHVRIDSNGELAFHSDGPALPMLKAALEYADDYGGRLKATVDEGDPKAGLLKSAGFRPYPATAFVYRGA